MDWHAGPEHASSHATMPKTGEEHDQRAAAEAQTQQNVSGLSLKPADVSVLSV